MNPKLAMGFSNRGIAYSRKGNYDQGFADYTKSIELDPKNDRAYANRAVILFIRKDYDRAWADVKKCQELGGTVNPNLLDELRKASGRTK